MIKNKHEIPLQYIDSNIPVLVINNNSPISLIYFHEANETLFDVYKIFIELKIINLISPKYGFKNIEKDYLDIAEKTLNFCIKSGFTGIIIAGNSIECELATHICNYFNRNIFGLILINPFSFIKKNSYKKIASVLLKRKFNNVKNIKQWNGKLITICNKKHDNSDYLYGVLLHEISPSKYKKLIINEKEFDNWKENVFQHVFKTWFS